MGVIQQSVNQLLTMSAVGAKFMDPIIGNVINHPVKQFIKDTNEQLNTTHGDIDERMTHEEYDRLQRPGWIGHARAVSSWQNRGRNQLQQKEQFDTLRGGNADGET